MGTTKAIPSSACAVLRSTLRTSYTQHQIRSLNMSSIPISKQKHLPPPNTTYPQNFLASAVHVGIKASNKKYPDLALLVSTTPCNAAAVFTQNRFQAAPVTVSREILQKRQGTGVRGVVMNAGIANAVTGAQGMQDAKSMVTEVGRLLPSSRPGSTSDSPAASPPSTASTVNVDLPNTLVMSTGIIGQPLPISKILTSLPHSISSLSSTPSAFLSAASAICTTDTFPKLRSRYFTLPSYPSTTFRMAGMAKGAGMIHPNMATLLGLIWTDAPIGASALDTALRAAADRSFNSISVDGDTSTNDTLAVLANGAAVPPLAPQVSSTSSPDFAAFQAELAELATQLAQLVVRDGEGATKFVTVRVLGAKERGVGKRVASSIATSPLVKTALYGKDANWGRILCAIGHTEGIPGGAVVPERTSVSFVRDGEELPLLVDGEPQVVDEARAAKWLEDEDLEIRVRLDGEEQGEEVLFWTCDLSHEYVTINGDYRT